MKSIEQLKKDGVWSEQSYLRGRFEERRIINEILDDIQEKYRDYLEDEE